MCPCFYYFSIIISPKWFNLSYASLLLVRSICFFTSSSWIISREQKILLYMKDKQLLERSSAVPIHFRCFASSRSKNLLIMFKILNYLLVKLISPMTQSVCYKFSIHSFVIWCFPPGTSKDILGSVKFRPVFIFIFKKDSLNFIRISSPW